MRARGWLDTSYPCEGGSELNTSWSLFVCTLTKGKKSPGEELQGEGIDRVLFPERLERLQEAPSAPPGKLDITRLVSGVALSPPPLPGCLIRLPEPSAPLPCSTPTGTPPPASKVLSRHHGEHGADPGGTGTGTGTRDGDAQRGAGMDHALSKGVPWVHHPASLVAGDVQQCAAPHTLLFHCPWAHTRDTGCGMPWSVFVPFSCNH